jgi:hypothetical protein
MKKHFLTFAFAALVCAPGFARDTFRQTPTGGATTPANGGQQPTSAISPNRVLGDVTAIDPAALSITLKVDGASAPVNVVLNAATVYYRVNSEALARAAKGAITPADMTKITLSGLGKVSDDQKTIPARVVIVATKEDIAQKQELDRAQWQRRGILGTVTAVNPATKEITVSAVTPEGAKPLVVDASGDKVLFRRYAPDSVKFADAKPSLFADVKVGDRLRALGERSADGTRFTPEEVVSGSFRQLVGTVTAVDAAANQIKIKTQDNKALTIVVNNDSNLRRLPPMMAQFMAQRAGGGANVGSRPTAGEGGGGGAPPAGGTPGAEGRRAGAGGGGQRRMMGGGFDPQSMLERMPQTTLAELKPGDMIVVSSTAGADPTRLTAIALVAGIDVLMNAMPAGAARPNVQGGQDLGLPGGIDLGIGLP